MPGCESTGWPSWWAEMDAARSFCTEPRDDHAGAKLVAHVIDERLHMAAQCVISGALYHRKHSSPLITLLSH